jgi:hypothetical protein
MFTHPDPIGQLAREHHRQMLAEASQRQRRRPHVDPAAKTPNAAAAILRRLAPAITRTVVVAAEAPDAIWPARPHPLGEPAAQGRRPGRGH